MEVDHIRFPLAALFFVIAGFVFLAFFGMGSLLLTEFDDALINKDDLDSTLQDELDLITDAFGYIAAIFFVTGILLIFILDSLSDEPEYFYRER